MSGTANLLNEPDTPRGGNVNIVVPTPASRNESGNLFRRGQTQRSRRHILDALLVWSGRTPGSIDPEADSELMAVVHELESAAKAKAQQELLAATGTVQEERARLRPSAAKEERGGLRQIAPLPVNVAVSLGSQQHLLETLNQRAPRQSTTVRAMPPIFDGGRPAARKSAAPPPPPLLNSDAHPRQEQSQKHPANASPRSVGALGSAAHAEMKVNQLSKLIKVTPDITHFKSLFFEEGTIVAEGQFKVLSNKGPQLQSPSKKAPKSARWQSVHVNISQGKLFLEVNTGGHTGGGLCADFCGATAKYVGRGDVTYATGGANAPETVSAKETIELSLAKPLFAGEGVDSNTYVDAANTMYIRPIHESEVHTWLVLLQTCISLADSLPEHSVPDVGSVNVLHESVRIENDSPSPRQSMTPQNKTTSSPFDLCSPGLRSEDGSATIDKQSFLAELLPFVLKNFFTLEHGMGSSPHAHRDAVEQEQVPSVVNTFLFKNELCSFRQHGANDLAQLHRCWVSIPLRTNCSRTLCLCSL